MDKRFLLLLTVMVCSVVRAQRQDDGPKPIHPVAGLHYNIEIQASGAKGQTPLWLNANRLNGRTGIYAQHSCGLCRRTRGVSGHSVTVLMWLFRIITQVRLWFSRLLLN